MANRRPGLRVRFREDFDTWERHAIVGRLVGEADRVLDVGGVPGRLAPQLFAREILAINVEDHFEEPPDVVYDGQTLPFQDDSFDVATSLDVLEHIDRADRARHVRELARVARTQVVLCCPLGSDAHSRAEQELADWYAELSSRRHPYLDEHVGHGLPTVDDFRMLADAVRPKFEVTLWFHGDFRRSVGLFRGQALAHFRHRPLDRARFAFRRLTSAHSEKLTDTPGEWTNRVFLVGSLPRSV